MPSTQNKDIQLYSLPVGVFDSFEVSLSCLVSGRRLEEPPVDEEERPESKSLCGGLPGSPRALGGQENSAPGLRDYDQVPPDEVLESRGENQGKVGQHFRPTRSGVFIVRTFQKTNSVLSTQLKFILKVSQVIIFS